MIQKKKIITNIKKMKTIFIISTCLLLGFNITVHAEEVKCKLYDVVCKTKKFSDDTINYQKKEFKKAVEKRKK
tara:strand:- start:171 stop:389 length:219 start_codon:yes stop_codon:yes gene_type:complete